MNRFVKVFNCVSRLPLSEYCRVAQREVTVLSVDKRQTIFSTLGMHCVLSNHYFLLYRFYRVDADCWSLCGNTLLSSEETEFDAGLFSYFNQILLKSKCFIYKIGAPPQWGRTLPFTRFIDHTQRRTTVSRSPLDE